MKLFFVFLQSSVWHMNNFRDYINLAAVYLPSKKIEDLNVARIGAGDGSFRDCR